MTVVEAIVKWLKEASINRISTDALPGQSVAYGIAKEPVQKRKDIHIRPEGLYRLL